MKRHKLKIGAHQISVAIMSTDQMNKVYEDRTGQAPPEDETLKGLFVSPSMITIHKDAKSVEALSIYLHEITEGMEYFYELGLEHQTITIIGEVLTQILVDNKQQIIKILSEL